ncbi:MAG: hypothetical protein U1E05_22305, partial [Patescibacteria group bacterium]|nr:hypothetical protein [Patescibacteria group bacterium]
LEPLEEPAEIDELRSLVAQHHETTGSTVAGGLLQRWRDAVAEFVKIMPLDYKRALLETEAREAKEETEVAVASAG